MMRRNFNDDELLRVICDIAEIKKMKATLKSSMNAGLAVGLAAGLGALFLGPRGAAVGGILGGLGTSYMMDGSFKSVPYIIMNEFTEKQKKVLIDNILELFTTKRIMSLAMFLAELRAGNFSWLQDLVDIIIKTMANWNYEFESKH